jgi:hypothetical protein
MVDVTTPSEKVRQHWQERKLPGDPFDLHGVLFLGTTERRGPKRLHTWVIGETHRMWSEHGLGIDEDDFNRRNAEVENPIEVFLDELTQTIAEKLL